MTFYYRLSIFTKQKRALYHNTATKETLNVSYSYVGVEGSANMFTGIDSVATLDNKPVKNDYSAAFSYLSRLCMIFPVVELVSAVALAVIFYINVVHNKPAYALGAAGILIILSLALFILNKYIETLFLISIPKKKGWVRAYIDDYNELSYPDEKTGKVVRHVSVSGGKKRISFVTQKEYDVMYNAFFGKDAVFSKKHVEK